MTELEQIEYELLVLDEAIAQVVETYESHDFMLAGSMVTLLARRIDVLLRGERLVAGTPDRHRFHAELRTTIDREQAARSLFACFVPQQTEQPETPGVDHEI